MGMRVTVTDGLEERDELTNALFLVQVLMKLKKMKVDKLTIS